MQGYEAWSTEPGMMGGRRRAPVRLPVAGHPGKTTAVARIRPFVSCCGRYDFSALSEGSGVLRAACRRHGTEESYESSVRSAQRTQGSRRRPPAPAGTSPPSRFFVDPKARTRQLITARRRHGTGPARRCLHGGEHWRSAASWVSSRAGGSWV